jgi:hypothetical protein
MVLSPFCRLCGRRVEVNIKSRDLAVARDDEIDTGVHGRFANTSPLQVAVDTDHHLIIAHEVTNTGSDQSQLANIASRAKGVLGVEKTRKPLLIVAATAARKSLPATRRELQ